MTAKPLLTRMAVLLSLMLGTGCTHMSSEKVTDQNDQVLNTQKTLIISFINKGLPSLALKEIRPLIKKHSKDADLRNLMGLIQLALKNPSKATEAFVDAINLDDQIPYILNLSSAHIEAGKYQAALKVLSKLKKHSEFEDYRHPERVYHNLGLATERLGQSKKSEGFYRQALKYNPNFYISMMRLASLYQNRQAYKKAKQLFSKAIQVCPTCFDPVNGLSSNFIAQGKPRIAIKVLQKYLASKEASEQDKKRALKAMTLAKRYQSSQKRR